MLLNVFSNSFKDKTKIDQKVKMYPYVLTPQHFKDRVDLKIQINL